MRPNTLLSTLIVTGALAGFAMPCVAQDTRPAKSTDSQMDDNTPDKVGSHPRSARRHAHGKGFLAGPTVSDEAMDKRSAFGSEQRRDKPVTVPAVQWMRMLRDIDLSPEQAQQSRAIAREMQAANEEFRKAHGKELRELRALAQQARADGQPLTDDQRARAEELRAKTPKAEQYQQRIWTLLDADQKSRMHAKLKKQREVIRKRRAEQRDKVRDRMDNMTDEDRERAKERASDRRDRATNRASDRRDRSEDRANRKKDRRND